MNESQSVARAAALGDRLAARAERTEAERRMLPETLADLRTAGLLRLFQPRRYGGAEAPLTEATAVISTLARACGSTAWVASVYTDHSVLLGKFDPLAADEVWGSTPDALISAGYMPAGTVERVPGGWQIAGTWGFASGCDHADWLLLGSLLPDATGVPTPSLCLVSRKEVEIEDNWHVLGLCGTGSKNIRVDGVHVPVHRTLALTDANGDRVPNGRTVTPLYQLPHVSTVPFMFSATGLGIAESLLDAMIAAIKQTQSRGQRLADIQALQIHVAESAAEIDCARQLLERDTEQAMAAVEAGRILTLKEKIRNRRDQAYMVKLCRSAVDRLFAAAGSRGLFESHVAQRKFRDMCAMSTHAALGWDIAATSWGRVAFGLDPGTPFI